MALAAAAVSSWRRAAVDTQRRHRQRRHRQRRHRLRSRRPRRRPPARSPPPRSTGATASGGSAGPCGFRCATATPTAHRSRSRCTGCPPRTRPRRIGTILLNPGGPGASGVQFAKLYGLGFPNSIRQRFDVVGWDPRGVGASDPIACGTALGRNLQANQAPVTAAQRSALGAANRAFGHDCHAKVGAILGNVSTVDTARDMDQIRRALGEQRITYVGYSYGTYLGAVYANMFPSHIRAMVLDGVSDPNQSAVQFLLDPGPLARRRDQPVPRHLRQAELVRVSLGRSSRCRVHGARPQDPGPSATRRRPHRRPHPVLLRRLQPALRLQTRTSSRRRSRPRSRATARRC